MKLARCKKLHKVMIMGAMNASLSETKAKSRARKIYKWVWWFCKKHIVIEIKGIHKNTDYTKEMWNYENGRKGKRGKGTRKGTRKVR